MAAVLLLIAYLLLIPALPPDDREAVSDAMPWAFAVGVLIGVLVWIVDQRLPRLFARFNRFYGILPGVILGVGIFLPDPFTILIMSGVAGMLLPVATPLAQIRSSKPPTP